jgi:hypothetical protein
MSDLEISVQPSFLYSLKVCTGTQESNVLLGFAGASGLRVPAQDSVKHSHTEFSRRMFWPTRPRIFPTQSLHPLCLVPTRQVCILNMLQFEEFQSQALLSLPQ